MIMKMRAVMIQEETIFFVLVFFHRKIVMLKERNLQVLTIDSAYNIIDIEEKFILTILLVNTGRF